MLKYKIENNKIIIETNSDFSVSQTLECGQVFRYKTTAFGYEVYSLNHKANIYCQKQCIIIESDDAKYFVNYFDLDEDYAKIKNRLKENKFIGNTIKFGEGIRILRQDPFETIISFLISQNNNIPRIKKIIELICQNYGENCGDYFAFPTLKNLGKASKEFFTSIKCGYRDDYLFNTTKALLNGFNLEVINTMPSNEANKYLTKLKGVGPKVADCILLYGFHKTDVFPTDTWIKKAYLDFYPNSKLNALQIRNNFVNEFGKLSGYAQQYLFYSKREKNT